MVSLTDSVSVAVESAGNTRFFKSWVEALGVAVMEVNTLKFEVVNKSVIKTDRHDSSRLVEFLEKDMLPVARLCSEERYNAKRGPASAMRARGRAVDPLFETTDRLTREVKKREAVIEELTKDDPMVEPLRTIPGAGLTPSAQNAAERQRHWRIAKRGPDELPTAMVQVVLGMVRKKRRAGTYRITERYTGTKPQKNSGQTNITTARKLSEIIWHMLHENQPFDETRVKNLELRRKAIEVQAEALDVA